MIDIKELRVGNYIGYYSYNENDITIDKIKSIYFEDTTQIYMVELASEKYAHSNISLQGLEPIPLTEERLVEWCGYKREVENFFVNDKASACSVFLYSYGCKLAVGYNEYSIGEGLNYLHQLQNLCFDLTGTELEIKL